MRLCSQLARLRTEAEENRKREESAKAALNAARVAQREGKLLSSEEIDSIQASLRGATEQAPTGVPKEVSCHSSERLHGFRRGRLHWS